MEQEAGRSASAHDVPGPDLRRPRSAHEVVEPIDELLETRVMRRILDEVVHGVPTSCVDARSEQERAFARRVRAHVERTLGEPPEEGCTSYVEWALGPDFGPGAGGPGGPGEYGG